MWVLAGVGIFAFVMAMTAVGESGSTQNPYMPLYAVFVAIWSINFSTVKTDSRDAANSFVRTIILCNSDTWAREKT